MGLTQNLRLGSSSTPGFGKTGGGGAMTAGERLELPKNCGLESPNPLGRVALGNDGALGTALNGLREGPEPENDPGLEPITGLIG